LTGALASQKPFRGTTRRLTDARYIIKPSFPWKNKSYKIFSVSDQIISDRGVRDVSVYLDSLTRLELRDDPSSRLLELYWTLSRILGRARKPLVSSWLGDEQSLAVMIKGPPAWRQAEAPSSARAPLRERPRLLIDMTSTLRSGKNTGIQRVVREIAFQGQAMGEGVAVAIHDGELLPYYRDLAAPGAVAIEPGDIFLMLDATWNHVAEYLPIIKAVKAGGGATIVGLHDILPLSYPAAFPPPIVRCMQEWMEKVVLTSDGVIAVSRAAAQNLRDFLSECGRGPPAFPIGWWRLGDDFSCAEGAQASPLARSIAASDRPYFLGVGTVEPRKGYPVVIDALEKLWADGVDATYVIVGSPGWGMRQFTQRVEGHKAFNRHLFWLKNASDADLILLYRSARALVLASVAEGFGLPIVEAAYHGTPVIATDIPVFREVAGESAEYFPPLDSDCLAEKIRTALNEKPRPPAIAHVSWRESAIQLFSLARRRD
jgi:glycosyltransferase involved in cell wall biosynthesis